MKELKKFQEYLKKLETYEDNVRTKEIKETINSVTDNTPNIIITNGENYIIYETENLEIKFNIKTEILEITKKQSKNNVEEITKTTYEIIYLRNSIYIITNNVVNCYVENDDGYNLLLSGTKLEEYFTKKGFLTHQKKKTVYCPNIIFRSKEDKEYCNFVTFDKEQEGFINVDLKEFCSDYFISSLNDDIKANPKECNNFVVYYNDLKHNICFPAFYHHDKTLVIDLFIDEPLLQYSGLKATTYNGNDISFEGRTINDFYEFREKRKKILENLRNCPTTLGEADKVIDKILKR